MGQWSKLAEVAEMILLTLRDLQHRAMRFLVVIVLGSLVFALLFVMTGLVEQFNREPFDSVNGFGASTWVVPEGISGPFTASSTISAANVLEVVGERASPAVIARSSMTLDETAEAVILIGHVPGGLGEPHTIEGRPAESPGEIVLDDTTGADVGDSVAMASGSFTVVGLSRDTSLFAGIPMVFMPLADAQELVFQTDQVVSVVLVDGDVNSLPPGLVAVSSDAVAEDALKPLEGAVSSVDLVRALLWMVAAVVIGAVVYLSALERVRDFAVLKAMGVSNKNLVGSLALQAVLVALGAVAFAAVIQLFLAPVFPLKVTVPDRAFIQIPCFAVLMGLVAGAAGMSRVARADPALAFAGAGG